MIIFILSFLIAYTILPAANPRKKVITMLRDAVFREIQIGE